MSHIVEKATHAHIVQLEQIYYFTIYMRSFRNWKPSKKKTTHDMNAQSLKAQVNQIHKRTERE